MSLGRYVTFWELLKFKPKRRSVRTKAGLFSNSALTCKYANIISLSSSHQTISYMQLLDRKSIDMYKCISSLSTAPYWKTWRYHHWTGCGQKNNINKKKKRSLVIKIEFMSFMIFWQFDSIVAQPHCFSIRIRRNLVSNVKCSLSVYMCLI